MFTGLMLTEQKQNIPKFEYDINNGVCLCHECHIKTDNYGYRAKKDKRR